jgi:ligand-binding sensor domain-containing protein
VLLIAGAKDVKAIDFIAVTLGLSYLMNSPDAAGQWVQPHGPFFNTVYTIAASDSRLFAGLSDYGVYVSPDSGVTWTPISSGLTNRTVRCLTFSGLNLFAATDSGAFRSSVERTTLWNWAKTGLMDSYIYTLAVSGTNLFAGTYNGVFLSTNAGSNWVHTSLPDTVVLALAISGTTLFAGTEIGVLRSTDNGSNWTAVNEGLTNRLVLSLAVSGTNLFAGTYYGGIFRSTNAGTTWDSVSTGLSYWGTTVISFAVDDKNLFAGTWDGVFLSTNQGTSWRAVGLPHTDIFSLAVCGNYLYAGTGDAVWRRPLSEMITTISSFPNDLPVQSNLYQNYPNPFNPSTTIRYALPARSHVALSVFNTLGQRVATLVNEIQEAGYHDVRFDGSNLSSGVYFYKLQAGSFVQTKKLLMLR